MEIWTALVDDLCLMSFVAWTQQKGAHPARVRVLDSISTNNLRYAKEIAEVSRAGAAPDRVRLTRRPPRDWWPSGLFRIPDRSWSSVVARGLVLSASLLVLARSQLGEVTDTAWRRALVLVERGQSRQFGQWRLAAGSLLAGPDASAELGEYVRATMACAGDLYRAGGPGGLDIGDVQCHHALPRVLRRSGVPQSWLSTWCDYPRRRENATACRATTRLIDEMRSTPRWPAVRRAPSIRETV
ncbi:hypothetical protein L1857_13440 [Amycolatopsis thermalba]|uniref:DUF1266 domain-containing protein n=1 Tax=Amycolatopsis thermalba TaxID=944492 RepID=A0ABY4NUP1_9PSEU|nr:MULTISPECIES: hypothetical protein [Amycolatopsis]UQS23760.1 hypothetical protein L1857_13440 [Amycolatopsis thermalba]